MGRLLPDLRFAARMFARQPTLAAAAVATLALGIGANSAIFSVVDSALLTPPPFREPGRVVVVYVSSPVNARQVGVSDKFPVSWGDFYEWGRQVRSFTRLAMLEPDTMSLAGAGPPVQLNVMRATGGFSAVIGTPAMLGRAGSSQATICPEIGAARPMPSEPLVPSLPSSVHDRHGERQRRCDDLTDKEFLLSKYTALVPPAAGVLTGGLRTPGLTGGPGG